MTIGRLSRWIQVNLDNHRKGGNKLVILENMTAPVFIQSKVLSRIVELRHEFADFLQVIKPHWSELFRSSEWTAKLAYMADIYDILNGYNISMQAKMALCFTAADTIDGMKRKLNVLKSRVSKNCFYMLHKPSATINETYSKLDSSVQRDKISEHLKVPVERFEMFFPSEEDHEKHNGLIRNPS